MYTEIKIKLGFYYTSDPLLCLRVVRPVLSKEEGTFPALG